MTSRRAFLAGALALPLATQIGNTSLAATVPSLGELAAAKGLYFGAAVTSEQLAAGDAYTALLDQQCGAYTAEWESKWGPIEYVRGYRNYDAVDAITAAARASNRVLRGHTLLWHSQLPPWADETVLNSAKAWDDLVAPFISETAARYTGQVREWDVVNEAIEPEWQQSDSLRKTPFLEMRGRGYIAEAFRLAAAADPQARLFINDYGLCYAEEDHEKRRVGMLNLLEKLVAESAPVHGLGIQGHLEIGRRFDQQRFARFLDNVAALGLDISITELDVNEGENPQGDLATRDQRNADEVRKIVEVALAQPNLQGVVTWSLSDAVSYARTGGGRPANRGLPFDDTFAPTAIHSTLAELFTQTADRRS